MFHVHDTFCKNSNKRNSLLSTIMADLLHEKTLSNLNPLHHLCGSADADDADDTDLIPAQPPSVLDQTIKLTFPSNTCETVSITRTIDVSLSIGNAGSSYTGLVLKD